MNVNGYNLKRHQIVVMDGSDEEVLYSILKGIDDVVIGYAPLVACRKLHRDHPTIVVIDTLIDDEAYDAAKMRFEDLHPGLCIFDPPMLMN